MSSLVHYEAFVDDCADIFSQRLQEHADRMQGLNMGHWFQCYAFDVISSITFGGRFGKPLPHLCCLDEIKCSCIIRLPGRRK